MKKLCSKCFLVKNITLFDRDATKRDGFYSSCKECRGIYCSINRNSINDRQSRYNKRHKKIINDKMKQYGKIHRKEISKKESIRLKSDMNFRLRKNLRIRLWAAVKNGQRTGSAVKDLGCSIEQFKTFIQFKFKPGMNWNNYGKWHLDHIIPLSSFDLTKRNQLLKACNYKNLQPLWSRENIVKGDSL